MGVKKIGDTWAAILGWSGFDTSEVLSLC